MRIGLYGGSFDPIHRGHIEPIKDTMALAQLDRVIYLPTANPPHKGDRSLAPAWMRYAMVEIALLREERLHASAFEMSLDRPAYTVETLEHHVTTMPNDELFLIIGLDSLAAFHRWRNWQRIVDLVTVLAMARPGYEAADVEPKLVPELQELCSTGRIRVLNNRPWKASSTEIRAVLRQGADPTAAALPALVLDYIHKYALYRDGSLEPDFN